MTTIVNALILSVIVFWDYCVIFSKVSGIKLTLWRMLFIFSIFTICHGFVHRSNLFDPLLFLGVSFLFDRDRKWSEHLFNSFFTTLLIERRTSIGGTGFNQVSSQIALARKDLS